MDKKLVERVGKKCESLGIDVEDALAEIQALQDKTGQNDVAAVLSWLSNNRNPLLDAAAYLMHYDVLGRNIKAKNGKDLIVHDTVLLTQYQDSGKQKVGIFRAGLFEGDRENPQLDIIKGLKVMEDSMLLSAVVLSEDGRLTFTRKSEIEVGSDKAPKLEDILKGATTVTADQYVDYQDAYHLFRGTVARKAMSKDGDRFGLELGHIPDDPKKDLVEPVMVWFPGDDSTTEDALEKLVGEEIVYVARYYTNKKDNTIRGSGIVVLSV